MSEDRSLPASRIGRFARLAAMGMRTGASMLVDRGGGSAAEHAAEVLGNLRGLAAKVGQMASYVDGLVPEQQAPAFEAGLKALRAQAPRSSPQAIRALVEEELGAPIDALFAEWDDAPLASASIGQVHRARMADGIEVAVKVQHPGIARAVESDLANASLLESFVGVLGGRRFDSKAMLQVIRARFREELDYVREAENLRAFATLHAGDATVRVPAFVASRSSPRVLTTELARGDDFEAACVAPEAERTAWARTMWRFVFKGTLVGGKLNADPHPGNYVFHDAGRVTFLDYGCIQPIDDRRRMARAGAPRRARPRRGGVRARRARHGRRQARPPRRPRRRLHATVLPPALRVALSHREGVRRQASSAACARWPSSRARSPTVSSSRCRRRCSS